MKPVIPSGPIETEPFRDRAETTRRMNLAFTNEVRALLAHEDAAILLDELAAAGVELGAEDRKIVSWLAGWEYGTLITIASWIKRAHAAGKPATRARRMKAGA